jgi:hypothetical protein
MVEKYTVFAQQFDLLTGGLPTLAECLPSQAGYEKVKS